MLCASTSPQLVATKAIGRDGVGDANRGERMEKSCVEA